MTSQERAFINDTENFLRKLQSEAEETMPLIQADCFLYAERAEAKEIADHQATSIVNFKSRYFDV
jgi:hypothetical protein